MQIRTTRTTDMLLFQPVDYGIMIAKHMVRRIRLALARMHRVTSPHTLLALVCTSNVGVEGSGLRLKLQLASELLLLLSFNIPNKVSGAKHKPELHKAAPKPQ